MIWYLPSWGIIRLVYILVCNKVNPEPVCSEPPAGLLPPDLVFSLISSLARGHGSISLTGFSKLCRLWSLWNHSPGILGPSLSTEAGENCIRGTLAVDLGSFADDVCKHHLRCISYARILRPASSGASIPPVQSASDSSVMSPTWRRISCFWRGECIF